MCGGNVGCDFRFQSLVVGAALVLALAEPISASTYFVGTNGVDSNPGSQVSPWLTIQKGLNTVAPGDTLIITPGYYYATNFTKTDGTAENPVTVKGQPGAWISWTNGRSLDANGQILGFAVSNSYYHIYGLSLYSNYMALQGTASHCILESNWLERSRAIIFGGCPLPYTNGPNYNIVRYNVFTNQTFCVAAMGIEGHDNYVDTNIWWTTMDNDAINFFGISNYVRGNLVVDMGPGPEHTGNHVDFMQTFGDSGQEAHWIFCTGNVISNSAGHFGIWANYKTGISDSDLQTNIAVVTDLYFINNVTYGGNMDGFNYALRAHFWNNTFYGPQSGIPCIWHRGDSTHGYARNSDTLNNIVVEYNGPTTPVAIDRTPVSFSNFSDYNYLTLLGGQKDNYLYGRHDLTGGYADFVSTNSVSGFDLHLKPTSRCIGRGTNLSAFFGSDISGKPRPSVGAWDIGAYAYKSPTTNQVR